MHTILIETSGVSLTPWTLIGLIGTFLFASRWIVQFFHSRSKGRSLTPPIFWYMSLAGSLLMLCYFIFGSKDIIGILSNSFPALIAAYNLHLLKKEIADKQS